MGTTRVTSYSADEVSMSFCGQPINSGLADGEFVTIEPVAEDFLTKKGADGETVRVKTNNRDVLVKVKLLHTSLSNNVLNGIRNLDLAGTNGAGVGVLEIRDRSSGVLVCHADKSWIEKPPSPARGREATENEWSLHAADAQLDLSGNPSL